MFTNIILSIVLLILIVELYIIYFIIRFTRTFLEEIRGIKGLQFGSLQVGNNAPLFRALDSNKQKIVLKDELIKNKVLMLFVNTDCSTCRGLIEDISKNEMEYTVPLLIINNDTSDNDNNFIKILNNKVNYIKSLQIFSSYHVNITPFFFLVNMNGEIESLGEIKYFEQLLDLLSQNSKVAS
ncbi:redoxin domain-containing protein [Neobacillus sp. OS1-2]|uniref:redoxin domain-containing protein n=1 Tax=Neobacillus sp. OS1-2 TaxID=3070680 RepID=UPI0027E0B283|nr:redoxin domain-containing protein [Neobacillus sp. OS1-2]WML42062.1 redoxin domain-containing protein [Neobacillus sp. OS1-2]